MKLDDELVLYFIRRRTWKSELLFFVTKSLFSTQTKTCFLPFQTMMSWTSSTQKKNSSRNQQFAHKLKHEAFVRFSIKTICCKKKTLLLKVIKTSFFFVFSILSVSVKNNKHKIYFWCLAKCKTFGRASKFTHLSQMNCIP